MLNLQIRDSMWTYHCDKKLGNRVLMVGHLRELALYRVEVLSQAGCIVNAPETIEQAVEVLKHRQFDAIILSYTLHSDTVQWLTDLAREHCPDCPVIAIAETNTLDRRINPDAVALANAGPPALIAALKLVMESQSD